MDAVTDLNTISGKVKGSGSVVAINNTGQTSLLPLIYAMNKASIKVAEKPFDAAGKHFEAGTLLIAKAPEKELTATLTKLSLDATRLGSTPNVATHPAAAPRVAIMHTWLGTQTEGWWRYAFDSAGVPFTYISTQTAAAEKDLRARYDVIVFAPVGGASSAAILNGIPTYANPLPWQKTKLTPNLGLLDSTADQRPGLGADGLAHLRDFVQRGGLLITCEDTAQFAIESGLTPGVSVSHSEARVVGSILDTVFVTPQSPIAYGYGKSVPVMSEDGMAFNISNTAGGGGHRVLMDPYADRPTGRGSIEDSDTVQGRVPVEAEPLPHPKPWEARPLNEEQMRNNPTVIPVAERPQVILRFSDSKDLLLSGLLDKPGSIAEHAIVVDSPLGQGNVLLFANLPIYRGETVGTYPLVFNAIMNYQHLH